MLALLAGHIFFPNVITTVLTAVMGISAKDSSQTVLRSPFVQKALPVADEVVNLEAAANPDNILLQELKELLTKLSAANAPPSTPAPPASTDAAAPKTQGPFTTGI